MIDDTEIKDYLVAPTADVLQQLAARENHEAPFAGQAFPHHRRGLEQITCDSVTIETLACPVETGVDSVRHVLLPRTECGCASIAYGVRWRLGDENSRCAQLLRPAITFRMIYRPATAAAVCG